MPRCIKVGIVYSSCICIEHHFGNRQEIGILCCFHVLLWFSYVLNTILVAESLLSEVKIADSFITCILKPKKPVICYADCLENTFIKVSDAKYYIRL